MKITYELFEHNWWLCVDYRRVAKLRGPYELELLQSALKTQTDLAAQTAVETMLKLLERGRHGELSSDELNTCVTVVQQ